MNKIFSILLGLALLVASIYAWGIDFAGFGQSALTFLKGGLVWFLIIFGLILVILGISALRD